MKSILICILITMWLAFVLLPIAETIYYYKSKKKLYYHLSQQLKEVGVTVTIEETAICTTFTFESDNVQEQIDLIYNFIWNEIEKTAYQFHSTRIEVLDERHIRHILFWK